MSSRASLVASAAPTESIQGAVVRTIPLCIPANADTVSSHSERTMSPSAAVPPPVALGRAGSRSYSTPVMPSPLRMVSKFSSSRSSAPAVTDDAVPTYGPPSLLIGSAGVPPTQGMLMLEVVTDAAPLPSSSPTDVSSAAASPLPTMSPSHTALTSTTSSATPAMPGPRVLPPRSSSPTSESSTPPTERSSPPLTPPASEALGVVKDKLQAVAPPARLTSIPVSISAGPLTSLTSGRAESISAGPLLAKRGRAGTVSAGQSVSLSAGPGPAPFSKINAKNCPENIVAIVDYLRGHDWGPVWDHCIATFIEVERFAQFKTRGTLLHPTEGRPREVAAWMKRARKLVDYPIEDVDVFAAAWFRWWNSNKPPSISGDVPANYDWAVLNVTGPNGLLLFMLTLAWWGSLAGDNQGYQGKWLLAVGDVRLVFDRVLLAAAKAYRDNIGDNNDDVDVELEGSARYVHTFPIIACCSQCIQEASA